MIRTKIGLLGLCAMLLGLMAFSANGAQAATKWLVEGKTVEGTLLPTLHVKEIEKLKSETDPSKHLVLLTKIAGALVHILCTGASLIGVKLEKEGKLTEGGKAKFTGCITFLNEKRSEVCDPFNGTEKQTVVSNEGKGQLLESGLTEIKPKSGVNFAVMHFNVVEGCSLPENVPVIGSLFIKDCVSVTNSVKEHLIEVDPSSKLFVIEEKNPEHAVTIHGSALLDLEGTDAGLAWSGDLK